MILPKIKKIITASAYSLAPLVKLCVLFAISIMQEGSNDFNAYTVSYGLTSAYMVFSGLRSRLYVLANVESMQHLTDYMAIQLLLSICALVAVYCVYFENKYIDIIVLVAVYKYAENLVDGLISYIHSLESREVAYNLLNKLAFISIIIFCSITLFNNLKNAIVFDFSIYMIFAIYAYKKCKIIDCKSEKKRVGFYYIMASSSKLTLAATLNSSISTFLLTMLSLENRLVSDMENFSKFLALQSIVARITTSQGLYFRNMFSEKIQSSFSKILKATLFCSFLVVSIMICIVNIGSLYEVMILLILSVTAINCLSILLRQQLILSRKTAYLSKVHLSELAIIVLFWFIFPSSFLLCMCAFFLTRLTRVVLFGKEIANVS